MILPFGWPWGSPSSGSGAAQVNADWNATSGAAEVLNKPPLFSGNYADLQGKPALFSGSYAELTGKPSIPAAQVPSDWSASSGVSRIINKPVLFSGAYAELTGKPTLFSGNYSDLAGRPSLAAVATSGAYADLTGKPAIPVAKRIETYTGTTNASGQIVVTYPVAFSQVPNVQPPPTALASQVWTLAASTTTGFTLQLNQRNTVTLLGIEVLLGATVPVVGSAAQIIVIER